MMPLLWITLTSISLFMFIMTATEISGNQASFLAIGWFVVFIITLFEAGSLYRTSRHKPTRAERDAEYWEKIKRGKRRG